MGVPLRTRFQLKDLFSKQRTNKYFTRFYFFFFFLLSLVKHFLFHFFFRNNYLQLFAAIANMNVLKPGGALLADFPVNKIILLFRRVKCSPSASKKCV